MWTYLENPPGGGASDSKALTFFPNDTIVFAADNYNGVEHALVRELNKNTGSATGREYSSAGNYLYPHDIEINPSTKDIYYAIEDQVTSPRSLRIIKVNSNFNYVTQAIFAPPGTFQVLTRMDIEIDSNGNVYAGGDYNSGPHTNIYLVKFNSSLNLQWNITYDTGSYDYFTSLELDSNDQPIIFGDSNNDYVRKYNKTNGNLIWTKTLSTNVGIYDVKIDSNNNLYGIKASIPNKLYKISGINGSELGVWTYPSLSNLVFFTQMDIDSNYNLIVGGTLNGNFTFAKINTTDMSVMWNFTSPSSAQMTDLQIDSEDNPVAVGTVTPPNSYYAMKLNITQPSPAAAPQQSQSSLGAIFPSMSFISTLVSLIMISSFYLFL